MKCLQNRLVIAADFLVALADAFFNLIGAATADTVGGAGELNGQHLSRLSAVEQLYDLIHMLCKGRTVAPSPVASRTKQVMGTDLKNCIRIYK